MRTFTAVLVADETGYTVTVPQVPGAISQGATREECLERIREALALVLDVEPDSFAIVYG